MQNKRNIKSFLILVLILTLALSHKSNDDSKDTQSRSSVSSSSGTHSQSSTTSSQSNSQSSSQQQNPGFDYGSNSFWCRVYCKRGQVCTQEPGSIRPKCTPLCGDGIVIGSQLLWGNCDDGNNIDGDGCSASCQVEHLYRCVGVPSRCVNLCGNRIVNVQVGEVCDNGFTQVDGEDGCFNNCTVVPHWNCNCTNGWFSPCQPICGDGVLVGDETHPSRCDDGNTNPDDGCHNCYVSRLYTCEGQPSVCVNHCGDGILNRSVGEFCDNGNQSQTDGCFSNCTVDPKWRCTGEQGQASVCTPRCGDGFLVGDQLEEGRCDDRNSNPYDGCHNCVVSRNFICRGQPSFCINVCGNRKFDLDAREQCDNGWTLFDGIDGCFNNCTINPKYVCTSVQNEASRCTPKCGDGFLIGDEKNSGRCDDGNTVENDGCTNCTVDRLFTCSGQPSTCQSTCGNNKLNIQTGQQCDTGASTQLGCLSNCTIDPKWSCTTQRNKPSTCTPICGDGYLVGQQTNQGKCDDGNTNTDDGCINCHVQQYYKCQGQPSICSPICGDGQLVGSQLLEGSCDDGNLEQGDGCYNCFVEKFYVCQGQPSVCVNLCGNNVFDPSVGQQCDNGHSQTLDGCLNDCTVAPGWQCSSEEGSASVCTALCGDGVVFGDQQCDDGNTVQGDGCFECQVEKHYSCEGQPSQCVNLCGNSVLNTEVLEECDNGNSTVDDGCFDNCTVDSRWQCSNVNGELSVCTPICGDGAIVGNEECDDGNQVADDGCTNCQIEKLYECQGEPSVCISLCGNQYFEPSTGEECDNGNSDSPDGCLNDCTIEPGWSCRNAEGYRSVCTPICGDGKVVGSQECDDANDNETDGCHQCKVQRLYICSQEPSVCQNQCNNGILQNQVGQQCDTNGSQGCTQECEVDPMYTCSEINGELSICIPICGDGHVITPQECDDGNNISDDGCSDCKVERNYLCEGSPSECTNVCGNSKFQPQAGQQCDNGQQAGCLSSCRVHTMWQCQGVPGEASVCTPICGDGFIVGDEHCDDGNTVQGDGCFKCQVEKHYSCEGQPSQCVNLCGNSVLNTEVLEECDNGNSTVDDGCFDNCTVDSRWQCSNVNGELSVCTPICGDGAIVGNEECDDGNQVADDGCTDCKVDDLHSCQGQPSICGSMCGNSILQTNVGQQCDNGNSTVDDGCFNNCTIDPHWSCTNENGQISVCVPICGDGVVVGGEQCDDGNSISEDGCAECKISQLFKCEGSPSVCTFECGNGILQPEIGQICDAGNTSEGCLPNCTVDSKWQCSSVEGLISICTPICGDGFVLGEEQCDDGNDVDGDGCSQCQIQRLYRCSGQPSQCVNQCGNSIFDSDVRQQCDDGNQNQNDGCLNNCTIDFRWNCTQQQGQISTCVPICGDGYVVGDQVCDDQNSNDDDGCNSQCRAFEPPFICRVLLNGTTRCWLDCNDLYGDQILDQPRFNYFDSSDQSDKAYCSDFNSQDGDGCTRCRVDPGYICRNYNYRIDLSANSEIYHGYIIRRSICLRCAIFDSNCIRGSNVCGDGFMAGGDWFGQQCDHPFFCYHNNCTTIFRDAERGGVLFNIGFNIGRDVSFFEANVSYIRSNNDIMIKYRHLVKQVGISLYNFTETELVALFEANNAYYSPLEYGQHYFDDAHLLCALIQGTRVWSEEELQVYLVLVGWENNPLMTRWHNQIWVVLAEQIKAYSHENFPPRP